MPPQDPPHPPTRATRRFVLGLESNNGHEFKLQTALDGTSLVWPPSLPPPLSFGLVLLSSIHCRCVCREPSSPHCFPSHALLYPSCTGYPSCTHSSLPRGDQGESGRPGSRTCSAAVSNKTACPGRMYGVIDPVCAVEVCLGESIAPCSLTLFRSLLCDALYCLALSFSPRPDATRLRLVTAIDVDLLLDAEKRRPITRYASDARQRSPHGPVNKLHHGRCTCNPTG